MRKKKLAATFPILFMSMTYFVHAQSFDVEKSFKMIERSISDIKKSKSDKVKAEIELAKRTGELSNACIKVTEEIKSHNLKIGSVGSNCSKADAELKLKQSLFDKSLQTRHKLVEDRAVLEKSIKRLKELKNPENSFIDERLLKNKKDKESIQRKLDEYALYDSSGKLIGGYLKSIMDRVNKDFKSCIANKTDINDFYSCRGRTNTQSTCGVHKDSFTDRACVEWLVLENRSEKSSIDLVESIMIALKKESPTRRTVSLNSQIVNLEKKLKPAVEMFQQHENTEILLKKEVIRAFENLSKANHPKNACLLLGVISVPPECSL